MTRAIAIVLAAAAVIFLAVTLLSGEPLFLIPVFLVLLLPALFLGVNKLLERRIESQHGGDAESAVADNEDNVPSTHLIPDDSRPLGDTPEAHDEISPHDLPVGHPGRQEAERQAGGTGGTTGGNAEGTGGGGPPADSTAESR